MKPVSVMRRVVVAGEGPGESRLPCATVGGVLVVELYIATSGGLCCRPDSEDRRGLPHGDAGVKGWLRGRVRPHRGVPCHTRDLFCRRPPCARRCCRFVCLIWVGVSGSAALHAQSPAAAAPSVAPSTVLVAVDQRHVAEPERRVALYSRSLSERRWAADATATPMDEELPAGSNKLMEYSFAKSPTIKVPGDWNTQRVSLMNYEGGFWYERHFQYQPQAGHRAFLHIGAANYRSRVWVNGQLLCTHEGGFTQFDCEATQGGEGGREQRGDLCRQHADRRRRSHAEDRLVQLRRTDAATSRW